MGILARYMLIPWQSLALQANYRPVGVGYWNAKFLDHQTMTQWGVTPYLPAKIGHIFT